MHVHDLICETYPALANLAYPQHPRATSHPKAASAIDELCSFACRAAGVAPSMSADVPDDVDLSGAPVFVSRGGGAYIERRA